MIVVVAVISIGMFIIAFWLLRIVPLGIKASLASKEAVLILRNADNDDSTREIEARKASIVLMRMFFSILYRSALTLAASFLPIWLADRFNWASIEEVTSFLVRFDVMFISSFVLIIVYVAGTRLWPSK